MSATIFDVAHRAGVSIGTVSRVVNKRDRVHPETRARVLRAIHDLDYHANAFAQGLASQQTETLGLVIPQVNDPFFYEIVRGIEDTATSSGYSLLIVSQPRQSAEARYLIPFRRGLVDAMILSSIDVNESDIEEIVKRGTAVVLLQQDAGKDIPAVVADNYGGAAALTEHLLGHGYRRFAYIAGADRTPDNRERLRAIRDTLRQHGLSLPDTSIAQGNYLRGSGYKAMLKLLDQAQRPEAVMAANDQMAADAIMAAQARGLQIPGDVAVVGFDDIPLAAYLSPPLTTVRQPAYDMGVHAVRTAINMLKQPQTERLFAPPRITLPTALVLRRSCGCNEF